MPFGDYADFEECVSDNQDKESPEGFCAWLHYQITGEWPNVKSKKLKGDENMPKKARGSAGSYEERRDKLTAYFDKDFKDFYIVYTFPDAIILKDYNTGKYYEIGYSIVDDDIRSGEAKEVEITYILKSLLESAKNYVTEKGINKALDIYLYYKKESKWPEEEKREIKKGTELIGPIFKKVEKQRIVYAAVLVPGEPDYDADIGEKILTAEEIEKVAHKWMEEYGNIDYMHGLNNVAKPVETFILPMDWNVKAYGKEMTLPKGTWILAAKVMNDKAWKEVEEEKLTGFSIMGIQNNVLKRVMENASKGKPIDKEINASMKRVLIRDLGKDWLVPFVSLVDEPCVPKAKFFAIKKKEEKEENKEGGAWGKIIKYFKKDNIDQMIDNTLKLTKEVEKAGRTISDDTYTKLKSALDAIQKLIEKADKERKPKYAKNQKKKGDELEMEEKDVIKLIDERLDEKLKPIDEGLKSLLPGDKKEEDKKEDAKKDKEDVKKDKKEDAKKGKEEDKKEEEKDEEKESLKAENLSLKETLEKLQEAKKALSKAEKGQEDGEKENKPYSTKDHLNDLDRDSLGRAMKKKDK